MSRCQNKARSCSDYGICMFFDDGINKLAFGRLKGFDFIKITDGTWPTYPQVVWVLAHAWYFILDFILISHGQTFFLEKWRLIYLFWFFLKLFGRDIFLLKSAQVVFGCRAQQTDIISETTFLYSGELKTDMYWKKPLNWFFDTHHITVSTLRKLKVNIYKHSIPLTSSTNQPLSTIWRVL